MALVVSTVNYYATGTSNTVPTGKIAKIRINRIDTNNGSSWTFGGNQFRNDSGFTTKSEFNGNSGTGSTEPKTHPVNGFILCLYNGGYSLGRYMWIKEDYILIAGEAISSYNNVSSTAQRLNLTVFLEDA